MQNNKRPENMERITTPELAQAFIAEQIAAIKAQVGDKKVLLALSGGVDSSVVAALLIRAIGKNLVCVHVNHGLLRKGEPEQVIQVFRHEMDANLVYVDAVDRFLDKLAGVAEPEQKRKIIGAEFIRVFEEEARKLDGIEFLAQGTIYPDILESGPVKAHHNVGGLPEDLQFELVEPLKFLFKDEVRVVGHELGLPDNMVYRQPFPGPGLGVRCVGAITRDRLEAVRESDAILREEFANAGLEGKVWQYFTIVPDFKTVGVKNNVRCFEWPVVLRAVNTRDAMTATVEDVPFALLQKITARITAAELGFGKQQGSFRTAHGILVTVEEDIRPGRSRLLHVIVPSVERRLLVEDREIGRSLVRVRIIRLFPTDLLLIERMLLIRADVPGTDGDILLVPHVIVGIVVVFRIPDIIGSEVGRTILSPTGTAVDGRIGLAAVLGRNRRPRTSCGLRLLEVLVPVAALQGRRKTIGIETASAVGRISGIVRSGLHNPHGLRILRTDHVRGNEHVRKDRTVQVFGRDSEILALGARQTDTKALGHHRTGRQDFLRIFGRGIEIGLVVTFLDAQG